MRLVEQGAGLNLRTPLVSIFAFRTVIILADGAGIATAKALIEATPDVGGLNFPLRESVRLYYRVGHLSQWHPALTPSVIASSTQDALQQSIGVIAGYFERTILM